MGGCTSKPTIGKTVWAAYFETSQRESIKAQEAALDKIVDFRLNASNPEVLAKYGKKLLQDFCQQHQPLARTIFQYYDTAGKGYLTHLQLQQLVRECIASALEAAPLHTTAVVEKMNKSSYKIITKTLEARGQPVPNDLQDTLKQQLRRTHTDALAQIERDGQLLLRHAQALAYLLAMRLSKDPGPQPTPSRGFGRANSLYNNPNSSNYHSNNHNYNSAGDGLSHSISFSMSSVSPSQSGSSSSSSSSSSSPAPKSKPDKFCVSQYEFEERFFLVASEVLDPFRGAQTIAQIHKFVNQDILPASVLPQSNPTSSSASSSSSSSPQAGPSSPPLSSLSSSPTFKANSPSSSSSSSSSTTTPQTTTTTTSTNTPTSTTSPLSSTGTPTSNNSANPSATSISTTRPSSSSSSSSSSTSTNDVVIRIHLSSSSTTAQSSANMMVIPGPPVDSGNTGGQGKAYDANTKPPSTNINGHHEARGVVLSAAE